MIRVAHIPISGFTQDVNRESGIEKLWRKMRLFVSEEVTLLPPLPWKSHWSSWAEFLWRQQNGGKLDVRIYAYSWGCGHGFVRLSKEFRKRGIKVRHAVLCDPVFHSWLRPWRAMIFSPKIHVPDNVETVDWFYQRQNKPQAKGLVGGESTKINEGMLLKYSHQYIDDSPAFHAKSLEVAGMP